MKPKHSAGSKFSGKNTPSRNLGIALFGDAASTEQQAAILRLVGDFESANGNDREKAVSMKYCESRFDKIARPLLIKALTEQDPVPFLDFVTAINAARRAKEASNPVHHLHTAILRLDLQRTRKEQPEMTVTKLTAKLCEILPDGTDEAQVRRACKQLGIPIKAGKRGRPKSDN